MEDCDAVYNQAVAAGAEVERPLANQFYGDRTGGVKDPFGFSWYVLTDIEDVTPEEMGKAREGDTTRLIAFRNAGVFPAFRPQF